MRKAADQPGMVYSTSPRRAILGLLQSERKYLTAAQIHKLLRLRRQRLALTTVYRTLQLLEKLGAVTTRSEGGGEMAYLFCANDEHHHHAICTTCGHVEEVNCRIIDDFRQSLFTRQSFTLEDHSMELYGRCAACR